MKILLLSHEDSLWNRAWSQSNWDLVIDLGWAGRCAYEHWSRRLGCPVLDFYTYAREIDAVRQFRSILDQGRGRLLDGEGLDWWNIVSVMVGLDLETLFMVSRLARKVKPVGAVSASRLNLCARAFGLLWGVPIETLTRRKTTSRWQRPFHYLRAASKLSLSQLLDVALDKWDPTYAVQRWSAVHADSSRESVVLLPSAYGNVSRLVADYARMLPDRQFLLVATRRSGHQLINPPSNVTIASLASYVPPARRCSKERHYLLEAWQRFKAEVVSNVEELALAARLGVFDGVPALLTKGLVIREAWKQVFEETDINAVLCGDENNPFTRMPVILGKNRGIRTVYCHHGALDVNVLLNGRQSEVYLAKGEMEKDYLIRVCGLSAEQIMVGSPNHSSSVKDVPAKDHRSSASKIVFFSEPYELYFGRGEEAYAEILPRLCAVAGRMSRKVIVKLHPFESRRERTKMIKRVLSVEQRQLVEVIYTPLSADFLKEIWFGVTVESSVTVECALQGVPCFLCGWLEIVRHGYVRQYALFGAGYVLDSPDDITCIPELLSPYCLGPAVNQRLWQPIAAEELDRLLSSFGCSAPDKSKMAAPSMVGRVAAI